VEKPEQTNALCFERYGLWMGANIPIADESITATRVWWSGVSDDSDTSWQAGSRQDDE